MTTAATSVDSESSAFDVESVRRQFPALSREVYGKPLVYLDSAASAQKPEVVIEAELSCYREYYANVHRGVHRFAQLSTDAYEAARQKVSTFIGAGCPREVVFVRGTTEGINLVASTFGRQRVGAGDEVLITAMEHHSNIVPWQLLCEQQGAKLVVAPMSQSGELIWDEFEKRLTKKTKLLSFVHVSNALGTINPAAEMTAAAQEQGIPVVIDGAQAAPHMPIDIASIGCDFYTLSGHKMFGPSGIGALYGKLEHLNTMPPYQGGGEMIRTVTFEKSEWAEPPAKFEAGTPNIAGAIGMGAAVDFLKSLDMAQVAAYEAELLEYGTQTLEAIPGLTLIGTAQNKAGVLSFLIDGVHAHDIGTILDREGIAVRAGHHCAQPVMDFYGVAATARASLALYNTKDDIDRLAAGIGKIREVFG